VNNELKGKLQGPQTWHQQLTSTYFTRAAVTTTERNNLYNQRKTEDWQSWRR